MKFSWNKKAAVSEPVSAGEVHEAAPASASVKWKKIKIVFLGGFAALVVTGSLGMAAYFHAEYKKVTQVRTPEAELESIVAEISEFFELPQGETPTLATVTDKDKLSGQEFFASSQNGDKVLLYQGGKKAILYRPSTGKIVNVAPINVTESAPEASAEVAGAETVSEPEPAEEPVIPAEPARIALYNGTTKTGLTSDFEEEFLASDKESFEVAVKENAAKTDYEATVVVDLSKTQSIRATQIAEKLGVSVDSLPDGEVGPDADILVILGADRL